ncbi:MAG: hypothetical protein IT530_16095 [Burkholderiales bacterium]|nr:hypothetical protein [Burkholderiales bacterium]
MVSTSIMIQRLEGCLGTGDLSEWEEKFVHSLTEQLAAGEITRMSAKQVDTLERLHDKHFAG